MPGLVDSAGVTGRTALPPVPDYSGNAHHGIWTPSAPLFPASGIVSPFGNDRAISFPGVNLDRQSNVTTTGNRMTGSGGTPGRTAALDCGAGWLPTGSQTVEAKVRIDAIEGALQAQVIFGNYEEAGNPNKGLILYWEATSNTFRFALGNGTGVPSVQSTTAGSFGTTHDVAGVWDGTNITIYLDGVKNGTLAFAAYTPNPTSRIYIGREPDQAANDTLAASGTWPYPLLGVVDEIRVSNIARYSATHAAPASYAVDANTVALYRMDSL